MGIGREGGRERRDMNALSGEVTSNIGEETFITASLKMYRVI